MSLETPILERQWEWEKIQKEEAVSKLLSLSHIDDVIKNISQNKDPDIQERLQNTNLESEVLQFISDSANGKLSDATGEYNSDTFDTDGENWLDLFEFNNFFHSLETAVEQIVLLDGIWVFNKIQQDSAYEWWLSPDKAAANYLDFQELFLWEKSSSFAQDWLNSAWLSNQELEKMSDNSFDITSSESWKEMWILLSKELWEWVEDMLRFLGNIPAWAILLPRYFGYRVESNSSDTVEATEGTIKLEELVKENPSLGLLELIWEKGVEMIQQLWKMLVSWKQWDIAMILVTIAGLIAGWAWAVKLWARYWKLWRIEKMAGNIQRKAEKVDDIVGGAWLWHLTWAFKKTPNWERVSSGVASEKILETNGKLTDGDRITKAEELLWITLSTQQKDALLEAHNIDQWRNVEKGLKLMRDWGFTRNQAQILMDQGVAWIFDIFLSKRQPSLNSEIKRWYTFEMDGVPYIVSHLDPETGKAHYHRVSSREEAVLIHSMDIQDIPTSKINPEVSQNFKIGEEVIIPRSDGSTSQAEITHIDKNWRADVSWTENGKTILKNVGLDKINSMPDFVDLDKFDIQQIKKINGKEYFTVIRKWKETSNNNIKFVIDWQEIYIPVNGKVISSELTLSPGYRWQVVSIHPTNSKNLENDIVTMTSWKTKNWEWFDITLEKPFQQVERNWDFVKVDFTNPDIKETIDWYNSLYEDSYKNLWRSSWLFETWKGLESLWISVQKGGINGLLGVMLSEKWIASKYTGSLTDGLEDWVHAALADSIAWLHGPYFVVKNSWRKEDYHYVVPDTKGISVLNDCLDELIKMGEMNLADKQKILEGTYTYEGYVKYKNDK